MANLDASFVINKDLKEGGLHFADDLDGVISAEKRRSKVFDLMSHDGYNLQIERTQNGVTEKIPLNFKYESTRYEDDGSGTIGTMLLIISKDNKPIAQIFARKYQTDSGEIVAMGVDKGYANDNVQKRYEGKGIMRIATSFFLLCLDHQGIKEVYGIVGAGNPNTEESIYARMKTPEILGLNFDSGEATNRFGDTILRTIIKNERN